ncbi:hypothetical protein [Roseateles sp.]|uniref:hypothetical protein n=1 Tax=Roseateles sp. TaxID=1971397 RepID=UPI0040356527
MLAQNLALAFLGSIHESLPVSIEVGETAAIVKLAKRVEVFVLKAGGELDPELADVPSDGRTQPAGRP